MTPRLCVSREDLAHPNGSLWHIVRLTLVPCWLSLCMCQHFSCRGGWTPEATSAWAAAVSALAAVVTAAIAIWALASPLERGRVAVLQRIEVGLRGSQDGR